MTAKDICKILSRPELQIIFSFFVASHFPPLHNSCLCLTGSHVRKADLRSYTSHLCASDLLLTEGEYNLSPNIGRDEDVHCL